MAPLTGIAAQYTDDPEVLRSLAGVVRAAEYQRARFREATPEAAPAVAEDVQLIEEILRRKQEVAGEQLYRRKIMARMDNLYAPETITEGGADHWPLPIDKNTAGRVHTSVNIPPTYVDIPAALQAVQPVENYVATGPEPKDREAASRREKLYFRWQEEDRYALKFHEACIVKGLYGDTAGKVVWDSDRKMPTLRIIDQPGNLWLGWNGSDYSRVDWALYCYTLTPASVFEDFGLEVQIHGNSRDGYYPVTAWEVGPNHSDPIAAKYAGWNNAEVMRRDRAYEAARVEVLDYWYRKPRRNGKTEIWNCIYVGNQRVENVRHPEYDDVPFLPLRNTYIPGTPYGKPELLDLEQLFREIDERTSEAGQMLHSIVGGQMWQLTGPEAPDEVPPNAIPKPNKVASPGPGNELKAIQPFVPEFAIDAYLKHINERLAQVSGINDLLLGLSPATILGSSKAIAALIANYEARIRIKRDLLYQWRKDVWRMAAKVWERKDSAVKRIIDGEYRIDVKAPELTPRDELEIAQMAINLVQNRIWSAERAMDRTSVEDPTDEKSLIKEEQTDASLNPAAVMTQAQLISILRGLGLANPQQAQEQGANAARQLNRPAGGTTSNNGPENRANPPGQSLPANAQADNGAPMLSQTMLRNGTTTGRVLTQQPLGGGQAAG